MKFNCSLSRNDVAKQADASDHQSLAPHLDVIHKCIHLKQLSIIIVAQRGMTKKAKSLNRCHVWFDFSAKIFLCRV